MIRPDCHIDEPLAIRALRAGDRHEVAAFIGSLSDDSRRRHFMGPKRSLTPRELAELMTVDHVRREALVALDPTSAAIVGLARYVARDERSADFAVTVADDHRRQGVGCALSDELMRRARRNGIRRLHATTFWDNQPARALLSRLGFHVCGVSNGVLDLAADVTRSQAA